MPLIAIVNPKGGSGKSTLATHLAGHAASEGLAVMLGDLDRQRSTLVWFRRRALDPRARAAPILSWIVDAQNMLRPPPGVTHIVLDTPSGLRGLELARVLMGADAILMPVCESAFDRDAAAACWAELAAHPRVANGRCRVAVVGMRIDARTRAEATLRAWADDIGVPFLGVLRDTQTYVRCVERGLTIFDLPPERTQADREQWLPLLDWLGPLLAPREPAAAGPTPVPASAAAAARVPMPREAQPVVPRPAATRPTLEIRATALDPGTPGLEPRRWFAWPWWPWKRA
jgi:chromosome partitioning protein